MELKQSDLAGLRWLVKPNHEPGEFEVVTRDGRLVAGRMTETAARLLQSAPAMLLWLGKFSDTNPVFVDLQALFGRLGIQLVD